MVGCEFFITLSIWADMSAVPIQSHGCQEPKWNPLPFAHHPKECNVDACQDASKTSSCVTHSRFIDKPRAVSLHEGIIAARSLVSGVEPPVSHHHVRAHFRYATLRHEHGTNTVLRRTHHHLLYSRDYSGVSRFHPPFPFTHQLIGTATINQPCRTQESR